MKINLKWVRKPATADTKQKKVKDPLLQTYLTSLLSLVLCVGMFMGTSFAWFTSEVNNTGNEIYIGTLDVGLFKDNGVDTDGTTSWADLASSETNTEEKLFSNDVRWEPGYTALETVKVVDEGDLAFDYMLTFTDGKIDGKTDEELLIVAEWFDVWVYHDSDNNIPKPERYADITVENGWTKVGTLADALSGKAVFKGGMDAVDVFDKNTAHTYTIALHMNGETVEENQEGALKALMGQQLALNVKLVASQRSSEIDGFGDGYDVIISTADELIEAIKKGGYIKLSNDIVLNGRLDIQPGVDVYLDMNGKDILITAESPVDYVFIVREGGTLTIGGDGTVETATPNTVLFYPAGNLIIEDGTFVRNVPEGYTGEFWSVFVGTKPDGGWESSGVEIYGGYFDGGYYDENAADVEDLLTGAKTLEETADDIAKRGVAGDKNKVRVALKDNTMKLFNRANNYFKIYGGTFVGANPAWGDEGCMLPTTPNYLRPWSYYQGALLEGQTFNENGIVLPEGYTITKGATEDGRPTYTVTYEKP